MRGWLVPDFFKAEIPHELIRKLIFLPKKIRNKVIRTELRKAAKTVATSVVSEAPYDKEGFDSHQPGLLWFTHLRNHIKVKSNPSKKRGEIAFRVATPTRDELGIPSDAKHYYPAAIEYGSLAWQPNPFMRRGLEKVRPMVESRLKRNILAAIEREARK